MRLISNEASEKYEKRTMEKFDSQENKLQTYIRCIIDIEARAGRGTRWTCSKEQACQLQRRNLFRGRRRSEETGEGEGGGGCKVESSKGEKKKKGIKDRRVGGRKKLKDVTLHVREKLERSGGTADGRAILTNLNLPRNFHVTNPAGTSLTRETFGTARSLQDVSVRSVIKLIADTMIHLPSR